MTTTPLGTPLPAQGYPQTPISGGRPHLRAHLLVARAQQHRRAPRQLARKESRPLARPRSPNDNPSPRPVCHSSDGRPFPDETSTRRLALLIQGRAFRDLTQRQDKARAPEGGKGLVIAIPSRHTLA